MDGLPYLRSVELRANLSRISTIHPLPCLLLQANVSRIPSAVTFIVGENGAGKSTLVEALAVAMGLNSEAETATLALLRKRPIPSSALSQTIKSFKRPKDWYFCVREFYTCNVYGRIIPAGQQGYGDNRYTANRTENRSWPSSLTNCAARFYLLDEPEAALSPSRRWRPLWRFIV